MREKKKGKNEVINISKIKIMGLCILHPKYDR